VAFVFSSINVLLTVNGTGSFKLGPEGKTG